MWEKSTNLLVKFYWGQNEVCGAGDSNPESFETAAKRQGDGPYTCDFGEGGVNTVKNIFSQEVSISFMTLLLVMTNGCHHEGV